MSIPAESLQPGKQILVQGTLTFGKLSQQYQGEELARRVAQQVRIGALYPCQVPHTTVNVADARVIYKDDANPQLEEQFVQGKIYTIKSGENQGKSGFGIDDKGNVLPAVYEKNEETGQFRPIKLERELASGLDVILVLETYAPKGHPKKGLGLAQVLINEPVRYYGGGASTQALAERGIVFEAPAERVLASTANTTSEPQAGYQGEGLPENTQIDPNSGLAMPAPGAAPAAPAVAQVPVATTVVAPIPTPAPAAAPADDKDAQIAALMAQIEAQNTPQGGSAFDVAPAAPAEVPAAAAAQLNPWAPA